MPAEAKFHTYRRDKNFDACDTAYKTPERFPPLGQDGNLSFQTIAESKSRGMLLSYASQLIITHVM
jgi:hypothetical protein